MATAGVGCCQVGGVLDQNGRQKVLLDLDAARARLKGGARSRRVPESSVFLLSDHGSLLLTVPRVCVCARASWGGCKLRHEGGT